MENKFQVWWIPQLPMKPFNVPVRTLEEANLVMDLLAAYDAFQFENKIKPDYCNAGGVRVWEWDSDGEGTPGWVDWIHPDTGDEFDEYKTDNLPDRYAEIKEATDTEKR